MLFPGLAAFLFRRPKAGRPAHSLDLGFLLLAAVWTIGFFSLSSCKLPTYVLPAFPLLCLLLGSMLDRIAFRLDFADGVARHLSNAPHRVTLTVLAIAAIGAAVDLFVMRDRTYGPMLDVVVLSGVGTMAFMLLRKRLTYAPVGWACAGGITLAVMAFTFNDFIPEIAQLRSINSQAAALQIQHNRAPVVFFGVDSHSAAFHIQEGEFVRFRKDELEKFQEFVRSHPETIIVTTKSADELREELLTSMDITPAGGRGHIFVTSHPEQPLVRLTTKLQLPDR